MLDGVDAGKTLRVIVIFSSSRMGRPRHLVVPLLECIGDLKERGDRWRVVHRHMHGVPPRNRLGSERDDDPPTRVKRLQPGDIAECVPRSRVDAQVEVEITP